MCLAPDPPKQPDINIESPVAAPPVPVPLPPVVQAPAEVQEASSLGSFLGTSQFRVPLINLNIP